MDNEVSDNDVADGDDKKEDIKLKRQLSARTMMNTKRKRASRCLKTGHRRHEIGVALSQRVSCRYRYTRPSVRPSVRPPVRIDMSTVAPQSETAKFTTLSMCVVNGHSCVRAGGEGVDRTGEGVGGQDRGSGIGDRGLGDRRSTIGESGRRSLRAIFSFDGLLYLVVRPLSSVLSTLIVLLPSLSAQHSPISLSSSIFFVSCLQSADRGTRLFIYLCLSACFVSVSV